MTPNPIETERNIIMKVLLLQDVRGSGKAGQIINVSDGYASNFLFPKKLAKPADAGTLNDIKNKEASKQHRIEVEKAEAGELAKRLEGKSFKIIAKAGTDERLFGAVTSKMIADAILETEGIEIDKKKIMLPEAIKTYGTKEVQVRLYSGVEAKINVVVTDK